jgi:hypothetical protein
VHQIKVDYIIKTLQDHELEVYPDFKLEISPSILDSKTTEVLGELYRDLGGKSKPIILPKVKFDFKIGNYLFQYDNENHFNRYRLNTLKSDLYSLFTYPWRDSYLRLCRNYERDCLQSGMQERIWNGPPLAGKHFGQSEEAGDLTGNGSSGWKLNAYNDAQIDLFSRLYGYKLVRIPKYENLMIGGGLKPIEQLIFSSDPQICKGIAGWVERKCEG